MYVLSKQAQLPSKRNVSQISLWKHVQNFTQGILGIVSCPSVGHGAVSFQSRKFQS